MRLDEREAKDERGARASSLCAVVCVYLHFNQFSEGRVDPRHHHDRKHACVHAFRVYTHLPNEPAYPTGWGRGVGKTEEKLAFVSLAKERERQRHF